MGVALYEPTDQSGQPLNTVYAEDTRQIVRMLAGTNDPGAATLSAAIASPGSAPSITLQAGGVTGSNYQWCAYWITGTLDGTGGVHRNGVTLAGPLNAPQNLSSQEAVATAPASPPAQAIGWGLCRNKSNGGPLYVVAEAFLPSYGGAWPQIVDDTPDSSLVTAAPASNTTGTSIGGVFDLLSGSSISGAISGSPTLSGTWTFDAGLLTFGSTLGVQVNAKGASTFTPPGGATYGTFLTWNLSNGSGEANLITIAGTNPGGFSAWNATGSAAPYTLAKILSVDGSGNLTANTLASTVATGTAPFSVASTTQVANLNAATAGQAGNATQWGGANNDIQNLGNTATPTTTSTSYVSAGIGLSLAPSTTRIQVLGMLTNDLGGVTATSGGIAIYRNTSGVPASGTGVGSDTLIASVFGANTATISPAYLDTGLTAGTTYYYYVAIASGQSGYSWGGQATFSIASR